MDVLEVGNNYLDIVKTKHCVILCPSIYFNLFLFDDENIPMKAIFFRDINFFEEIH